MHFPLLSVLPTVTGTCDQNLFYVSVTYGNQGRNFETLVGPRQLTFDLAESYHLKENGTHFSLVVPFTAKDTAFEVGGIVKHHHKSSALGNFIVLQLLMSDSVRARLDMLLYEPNNNWVLADFYLACNFPLTTTSKLFWCILLLWTIEELV